MSHEGFFFFNGGFMQQEAAFGFSHMTWFHFIERLFSARFAIQNAQLLSVRRVTQALAKTRVSSACPKKYLLEKVALLTLPSSGWPPFTQGMPPFPTHPTELLLEMGLCYRAPGGLTAGAGGRQEQAPSAMDSSSTLAESARERPELGMTPPSKVPDGFIGRPQLRFPSPLNFPALLFFWDLFFQLDQYIFQRSITPQHPRLFLLTILLSSPFNTSNPSLTESPS